MPEYTTDQIIAGFGESVRMENGAVVQDDPAVRRAKAWADACGMTGHHYRMPLDIWPTAHPSIWQGEWAGSCMDITYIDHGFVFSDRYAGGETYFRHAETYEDALLYATAAARVTVRDQ